MRLGRAGGRGQSGEGKIGLIIGILVVVAAIYLIKLMVPPRITRAEIADFAEGRARMMAVNQVTEEQLIASIREEVTKKGITLGEDGVQIIDGQSMIRVIVTYDHSQKVIGGKTWTQHVVIEKEVPRLN
jgi:hypothetical protein